MKIFPELYPDAVPRKYTNADIEGKTEKELQLMRNEIFARHGRVFETDWIQKYFESQEWYKSDKYYNDDLLTETDKYNIEFLYKAEQELKKKYEQK
jgi:hypothetical protein